MQTPPEIRNNISGIVRLVSLDTILEQMDPSTHNAIRTLCDRFGGIALFQVLQLDSSRAGELTCVAIGGSSIPSPAILAEYRIGSLPSNFAYPIMYALKG